jgi:surface antigen
MKRRYITTGIVLLLLFVIIVVFLFRNGQFNPNPKFSFGQPLDSLNGVIVYYNGSVPQNHGRNKTPDGYNIGLKYQCVEFVKRYYYQRYHHKMPDAYGNAKDFFDTALADSAFNINRALIQYRNGSVTRPQIGDLLVFDGHPGNPYGHVAIASFVTNSYLEIIQQNPGPYANSRDTFSLSFENNKWYIVNPRLLGWLRKQS